MTPMLVASNLEKSFGSVVAARNVSCEIHRGEIVGIIGANGAGKTTFVNMISGHLVPTQGEIRLKDRNITGTPSRKITQLGVGRSFQIAQVFSTLTAFENMCVATAVAQSKWRMSALLSTRMASSEILRAARSYMGQFGISEYADVAVEALPQGIKKILDVAMAAAGRPHLILLDEPTSGVSLEERYQLMKHIIQALTAQGVTVLFVEHDMKIVADFAQRVLAFIDGTVVADGPPASVFSQTQVRELITGGHGGPRQEG